MSEVSNYGFSDEWRVSEEDPGYMVKTIVVGNVTCDILRPILAPEERAKREKQIMQSIARTMAPYIRKERMNNDGEDERTAS